jgi:hypothetical protein
MKTAYRTTVSLSPILGEKLQKFKNKSAIIEESLKYFFEHQIFLEKAKNRYKKEQYRKNKLSSKSISSELSGVISEVECSKKSENDYKDYLEKKYL